MELIYKWMFLYWKIEVFHWKRYCENMRALFGGGGAFRDPSQVKGDHFELFNETLFEFQIEL